MKSGIGYPLKLMTASLDCAEMQQFRSLVAGRLGLELGDGRPDFTAVVLAHRLSGHGGMTPSAYLDWLAGKQAAGEWRALAAELTVSETYFFRGSEHCRALTGAALPERIRVRAPCRRLRLLSAGCASGEEAYTLAILLREYFPELDTWNITISAVDVNPEILEKAKAGSYTAWSLRETPDEIRQKYFHPKSGAFLLDPRIRSMVTFEEGNLIAGGGALAVGGDFDVILCRNVLMYLTPEAARQAVDKLTGALAAGGYLFLGYAESLRGLSQQFHVCHTHESFYYRSVSAEEGGSRAPEPAAEPSWRDAIENTCRRIGVLAQGSQHASHVLFDPPSARRPVEFGLAFDLLRQDRFGEALHLLDRLPPGASTDADTRLLQAVLLANCGDPGSCESICREVLGADDLNASAHYMMALCRDHAGDVSGAIEHDRTAVFLDATFAMPHLHLGRLAKRGADQETARHELQRAATLLLREDAARVLLFGGGFTREALVALCRAEFVSSGGIL